MHTPNSSMVKCVTSLSFLLVSLVSIYTALWVYPPQKNYSWSQWFHRTPTVKIKSGPAVPIQIHPAQLAAHPAQLAMTEKMERESLSSSETVAAPTRTTTTASSGSAGAGSAAATPTQFKEELESAMKLVDTGKPADAVPILTKILEKEPNNEMALVELAMIHLLDFKDPAASVPLLEKAVRVNPGNQVVMSEMLGAYEEMGQPETGMNILQQMYEEQPQNRELAYGIGKSYSDMGENSRALPFLAEAAKDGKNIMAMEQFAHATAATGSVDDAVDIYRSIVDKEIENQKSGLYASEPDQGVEKVALARMAAAHALMEQAQQSGVENTEAAQEQMAEIGKLAPTPEAKAELFEKFRRKNMR